MPDPALPRYDLVTNYRAGGSIEEMERSDEYGDWCRFEDVEAHLRAVEAAHQQELQAKSTALEMCDARLRGMQDFLSGQPRDLPYRGSDGQAKESQLNFAWCLGYDCASESEVLKLFVGRADRTAARAEAAEARLSALQIVKDSSA
jgi:hypothetical protein